MLKHVFTHEETPGRIIYIRSSTLVLLPWRQLLADPEAWAGVTVVLASF